MICSKYHAGVPFRSFLRWQKSGAPHVGRESVVRRASVKMQVSTLHARMTFGPGNVDLIRYWRYYCSPSVALQNRILPECGIGDAILRKLRHAEQFRMSMRGTSISCIAGSVITSDY